MTAGRAIQELPAYVPGFAEDVFISYAHIDNAASEEWVSALDNRLQERVTQLLGRRIRVYRDRKLSGVDALWDVLRDRISRSAIFLSVLSPRYVASEACRQEAACFGELVARSGMATVEGMSRIVRVKKTPYLESEEPPSFQTVETLGFRFFEEAPEGGRSFTEFTSDKSADPDSYQQFFRMSENLAQAVAKLLQAMRESRPPEPSAGSAKTVFVANTTSDRAADRQSLLNTLKRKGYRVVAPDSASRVPSVGAPAAEGEWKECSLSVHLMGSYYGVVPEGARQSVVQMQFEVARSHKLRQLVWIPPELDNIEEAQSKFLASIEHSGDERCDVVRERFGLFLDYVCDELAKPARKTTIRAKSVYLLCDKADLSRPWRKQIRSFLMDQGYPVFDPAFEGDVSVIRELEADNIVGNDATLIYYGTAADSWVMQKRKAILKTLAASERQGARIRAVYLCTPDSDVKEANYRGYGGDAIPEEAGFPPLLILGDCTEFTPEKLKPLLEHLEADATP